MSEEVKNVLQNSSEILIYLGLFGYELVASKNMLYLRCNENQEPITYIDAKDGALELACDMKGKRIYITIKKGKQSFCVKQNDTSLTGVSLKTDGSLEMFVNDQGISHSLTLTQDSFSFSYDEKDKNVAAKCYLGGLPKGNREIFLNMIAKIREKIIGVSVERITRTHTLLFCGEMAGIKGEFQPLVTIKGRDKSDLPSEWVDNVLFPEDSISYFERVIRKIEEFYPGFIDYMRSFHATFANAYPEAHHRKKETILQKQWPFFLENVKERYLSNKPEEIGFSLNLVSSAQKS